MRRSSRHRIDHSAIGVSRAARAEGCASAAEWVSFLRPSSASSSASSALQVLGCPPPPALVTPLYRSPTLASAYHRRTGGAARPRAPSPRRAARLRAASAASGNSANVQLSALVVAYRDRELRAFGTAGEPARVGPRHPSVARLRPCVGASIT